MLLQLFIWYTCIDLCMKNDAVSNEHMRMIRIQQYILFLSYILVFFSYNSINIKKYLYYIYSIHRNFEIVLIKINTTHLCV